jgi:methionine-rich copper-binding protein CopC
MALRTALAIAIFLTGAGTGSARPLLEHATPAPGSTVLRAPPQIALLFTEPLSASGSDAVVRAASGGVVSSGKARVLGKKAQMQVPLNSLAPGKYRVEWLAVSTDKSRSQGSFDFSVSGTENVRRAPTRKHPPGRKPQ